MKNALITLAALPLVAGIAFASPLQDSMQSDSMQSDSMQNGMMHHKGMMNMPGFDKLDANRDGYVSMDEMKMAHHPMMMDHWNKMDANADGKVSRSEYMAFKQQSMGHKGDMGHDDDM